MERYNNIVKIEKIKKCLEQGDTSTALLVAETVKRNKLKNMSDLSILAEAYFQSKFYEKSKEIFTMIYEKSRNRRIVAQLVHLSIKLNDVEDAEKYLKEFNDIAPKDFYRHIFRYSIDKMLGKDIEALIEDLEVLKADEYMENWAYELAKLYHKSGEKEKCIKECSDIILWFGNGIYVDKAKALKGYYTGEITIEVEELNQHQSSKLEYDITNNIDVISNEEIYNNEAEDIKEPLIQGEEIQEDMNSFAKSMDRFPEEVNSSSEEIEVINLLESQENIKEIFGEQSGNYTLSNLEEMKEYCSSDNYKKITFKESESKNTDGETVNQETVDQEIVNQEIVNQEIGDQVTVDQEILNLEIADRETADLETEEVKATEINEEESEALAQEIDDSYIEDIEKNILFNFESDIITTDNESVTDNGNITDMGSVTDNGNTAYKETVEMNELALTNEEKISKESTTADKITEENKREFLSFEEHKKMQMNIKHLQSKYKKMLQNTKFEIKKLKEKITMEPEADDLEVQEEICPSAQYKESIEDSYTENNVSIEIDKTEEKEHKENNVSTETNVNTNMKVSTENYKSTKTNNLKISDVTEDQINNQIMNKGNNEIRNYEPFDIESLEVEDGDIVVSFLKDDKISLGDIFHNFIRMKEVGRQIISCLNYIFKNGCQKCNIIITGSEGSGKTYLAKCIAKFVNIINPNLSVKVAIIDAEKLNRMDINNKKNQLNDAILIIQSSQRLSEKSIKCLLDLHGDESINTSVILQVSNMEELDYLINLNSQLEQVFSQRIYLKEYELNDYLGFVCEYLHERDYEITLEAYEEFETIISRKMNEKREYKLKDVFSMLHEAMLKAEQRSSKQLYEIMQSGNFQISDLLVIRKEDLNFEL